MKKSRQLLVVGICPPPPPAVSQATIDPYLITAPLYSSSDVGRDPGNQDFYCCYVSYHASESRHARSPAQLSLALHRNMVLPASGIGFHRPLTLAARYQRPGPPRQSVFVRPAASVDSKDRSRRLEKDDCRHGFTVWLTRHVDLHVHWFVWLFPPVCVNVSFACHLLELAHFLLLYRREEPCQLLYFHSRRNLIGQQSCICVSRAQSKLS